MFFFIFQRFSLKRGVLLRICSGGSLVERFFFIFLSRTSLGEASSEFLQREPGRTILLFYSLRWLIRGYSLGPPKGYSLLLPKRYFLWPPKGNLWEGSGRLESDSCYAKLLLFRPWKGTAFWAPVSRRPGKAILLLFQSLRGLVK